MTTVQFARPQGDFFLTLRTSVQAYFDENQLTQSGNKQLYWKAGIIIAVYLMIYGTIMLAPIPGFLALILAAFLGLLQAFVGFNIMHDACHEAFSTRKSINFFFGLSMNALGSDAFMWKQKHNIVHHTFTNVEGIDDDIAKSPLLRMCTSQPRYKAHRFQHLYLTFLYGISTLYWVLVKDWESYFKGKEFNVKVDKMTLRDHFIFWITKIIYFGLYLVLPTFVWGFGWTVLGFVLMHLVLGATLSFVFQLAHVVENVEFEHAETETTVITNEWAVHQINTTSDFAVNNRFVSWFLGGLNYQVEHHLFPRVSHVHYPAIQKIVAKTCADFGVSYRSFPTTRKALASHFRHMKNLGKA